MDPMDRIRELLGRVTDLSDQELTELRDLVMTQFDTADPGDEGIPDEAALAVMRELADASDLIQEQIASRNEQRTSRADFAAKRDALKSAELAADPGAAGDGGDAADGSDGDGAEEGADDDQDDADDGAAGDKAKEESSVTAGAAPGKIEVPADRRPKPTAISPTTTVVASADVPGYDLGQPFNDSLDVAKAMVKRIDSLRHVRGGDGEQVIVASINLSDVPEDRHLKPSDGEENYRKVMDVVKPSAVVAAGGVFAPLDTRYDLFGGGVTDRPVRDMLPSFTADRGGIRFVTSPTLAQLEGAVGVWTVQDDEDAALPDSAGPPAFVSPTKPILRVAAGTEVTVNTQAVTVGLVFGNMQARAYPELVARHTDLAMVAHARIAEQQLLAQIGALSLQVTTPAQVVGAARHILVQCDKAAAAYRNRYRTGALPLRAIFPTWFKDLLRADIALQMPGGAIDTFALADTVINQWFSSRNINVTWALDGEAGQDYAAQGNNAVIQAFKEQVIWYLFVEGTFLFLDGGTLDLGIVRDSTLNAKNDYQTFVETFEAVAKVGWESLRVTSDVDPTGAAAALVAVGAEAI